MSFEIKPTYIVFNLSSFKHLSGERQFNKVYCSPRMVTEKARYDEVSGTYISSISVPTRCSVREVVDLFESEGNSINGIIIFVDIYILSFLFPYEFPDEIPVVAVLGDTHHGKNTILGVLEYIRYNGIKRIALKQSIAQNPLWEELGFCVSNMCIHYSGTSMSEHKVINSSSRSRMPLFYGSFSPSHGFRRMAVKKAILQGADIKLVNIRKEHLKRELEKTFCVFNATLAGDINLRLVEAVSCGCLVIMDRLPDYARENLIFKPGIHYIEYTISSLACVLESVSAITSNSEIPMRAFSILAEIRSSSHMGSVISELMVSDINKSSTEISSLCIQSLEEFEIAQNQIARGSFEKRMLDSIPVHLHKCLAFKRYL